MQVFKIFILLFSLVICNKLLSQPSKIIYQKCWGGLDDDYTNQCIPTQDGGFLIIGCSYSSNKELSIDSIEFGKAWVIKTNGKFEIEWQHKYGGNKLEAFYRGIELIDGYLLLGFATSDSGNVTDLHYDPNHLGTADIWVVKINKSGKVVWDKCYGGILNEIPSDFIRYTNNRFLIIGKAASFDGDILNKHPNAQTPPLYADDLYDGWIFCIDTNGNIIWQKCIGGGYFDEIGNVVIKKEKIYIAGSTYSFDGDIVNHHSGGARGINSDGFIICLDTMLNTIWSRCYGGSKTDEFLNIIVTGNNLLSVGSTDSYDGDFSGWTDSIQSRNRQSDGVIVLVDSIGNIIKQYVLDSRKGEDIFQRVYEYDKSYYTIGIGYYNYWLVNFDSTFNVKGQCNFGGVGNDWLVDLVFRSKDSVILVGSTTAEDRDVICHHKVDPPNNSLEQYDGWSIIVSPNFNSIEGVNRKLQGINLSPNPVQNVLYISMPKDIQASIKITDLLGRLRYGFQE